jgi:hypothetical protein
VTRPTLLTTHSPVVLRGSHPFFSAYADAGAEAADAAPAAADTPQLCSATTFPISPRTYAREAASSSGAPAASSSPNTCRSRRSRSAAVVRVSPHSVPSPPRVAVSPNRSFAASSPSARPITSHSAEAESLSLCSIIAAAYARSRAVGVRRPSRARRSSAARMSTLTMLAVSNSPSPYAACAPESMSSPATETRTPSGSTAAPISAASSPSRSADGPVTDLMDTPHPPPHGNRYPGHTARGPRRRPR